MSMHIQEAMKEPDRTLLLFKARMMSDAVDSIGKILSDGEEEEEKKSITPEQRKQKAIRSVPSLSERVGKGGKLPVVEFRRSIKERVGDEKEMQRGILDHVVNGGLKKDLFVHLMDMMVMKWDRTAYREGCNSR